MMTNKKQIPFDFALWGQDGISVETYDMLVTKLHENPIRDEFYGVAHDGSTFAVTTKNLTMYQEVKPREIWVNEYEVESSRLRYFSLDAEKLNATDKYLGQVKFREVIE